jgi:hypothetical protein
LYGGLIDDRFQGSAQALAREALSKLRCGLDERSLDPDATQRVTSLPPVDEASSLVLFLPCFGGQVGDRGSVRAAPSGWSFAFARRGEPHRRAGLRGGDPRRRTQGGRGAHLPQPAHRRGGILQREIKLALDFAEEQPLRSSYIIPVMIEECELPERLQRHHRIDLFAEKGYDRLSKAPVPGCDRGRDGATRLSTPPGVHAQAAMIPMRDTAEWTAAS